MMIQEEAPSADAFVVVVVVTLTTLSSIYISCTLDIFYIEFFFWLFYFSLVPSYHHVKYSKHTHTRFRFTVLSVFEHFLSNNTHIEHNMCLVSCFLNRKKKMLEKKIIHIYMNIVWCAAHSIKKLLSVCI